MTFTLVENIALEAVAVNADGSRRVRLISPGQGSSGVYSREVLSRYVAEALPKGTLVYLDHTTEEDVWKRDGNRSIKDIAGKFVSDPTYEAEAKEGEGSYVNIKFTRDTEPLIEDVGDAIGVSIEIHAGRKDEYGNIVELHEHPLNALAIVPVPGRDGRIFEDFRAKAQENRDNGGTDMPISEEDRKAIVTDVLEGLKEAIKPEPAENEPVEIDITAIVTKVSEAKLPTVLVGAVVESVKAGSTVEDAIKVQTALVESIRGKADDNDDTESVSVLSEGQNTASQTPDIKTMKPSERGELYEQKFFTKKGGKA